MYAQDGYKTITPIQITNAVHAFHEKKISFLAFKVYFACFELTAIREAARRFKRKRREKSRKVAHYKVLELSRLTQASESKVLKALRSLKKQGLLSFEAHEIKITKEPLPGSEELLDELSGKRSPKRPIPLLRPLLRYLCQLEQKSLVLVLLTYMIRGLSITRDTGEVSAAGTAKASWIASVTGLTVRSVRNARAKLIQSGIISDDENSTQIKLNRTGAYFTIDLFWGRKRAGEREMKEVKSAEISPLPAKKSAQISPPYKDKKTSYEFKNQKTQQAEKPGFLIKEVEKPTLKAIQLTDLQRVSRLSELYAEATEARWLEASEASFQNFVAAAVRAIRIDGDPVRVFVGIVKGKLWHHITNEQEDRARAAIKNFREGGFTRGTRLPRSVTRGEADPMRIGNLLAEFSVPAGLLKSAA